MRLSVLRSRGAATANARRKLASVAPVFAIMDRVVGYGEIWTLVANYACWEETLEARPLPDCGSRGLPFFQVHSWKIYESLLLPAFVTLHPLRWLWILAMELASRAGGQVKLIVLLPC